MFGKQKIYKVRYQLIGTYETLVVARNPKQAIKKVQKQHCNLINILSIKEVGSNG